MNPSLYDGPPYTNSPCHWKEKITVYPWFKYGMYTLQRWAEFDEWTYTDALITIIRDPIDTGDI